MLSLAARCADTVALMATSLHTGSLTDSPQARSQENVNRQIAQIREAAGTRFDDLELCLIGTVANGSDRQESARNFAAQRGWQVAPEAVLDMPSVLVGDLESLLDHVEQVRAETGVSYFVVRDSQLDVAAPLVERIKR
jgi:hypothetical protein